MTALTPIVALSHLRWDFAYQRPQHLLTRLAVYRPVIYIEEPVHSPGDEPRWERFDPAPNVRVYRPHTPVAAPGFGDEQFAPLRRLLAERRAARAEAIPADSASQG